MKDMGTLATNVRQPLPTVADFSVKTVFSVNTVQYFLGSLIWILLNLCSPVKTDEKLCNDK